VQPEGQLLAMLELEDLLRQQFSAGLADASSSGDPSLGLGPSALAQNCMHLELASGQLLSVRQPGAEPRQ